MSQFQNNPYTAEQSIEGAMQFEYIINRMIGKKHTITLVRIESVEAGGTGEVGFVTVMPLVMQIDGDGNGIKNTPLYKLPYFRLQGGSNAIIIDPKKGDLGLAAFADRDISLVKTNKKESLPASKRQFDISDGLYFGGFLNGAPAQYVHFLESGIDIVSTGKVSITAPSGFELNSGADTVINSAGGFSSDSQTFQANAVASAQFTGGGGISADGNVTTTKDMSTGTISSINNHAHSGVTAGGSNTGIPT